MNETDHFLSVFISSTGVDVCCFFFQPALIRSLEVEVEAEAVTRYSEKVVVYRFLFTAANLIKQVFNLINGDYTMKMHAINLNKGI